MKRSVTLEFSAPRLAEPEYPADMRAKDELDRAIASEENAARIREWRYERFIERKRSERARDMAQACDSLECADLDCGFRISPDGVR